MPQWGDLPQENAANVEQIETLQVEYHYSYEGNGKDRRDTHCHVQQAVVHRKQNGSEKILVCDSVTKPNWLVSFGLV